jgi:oligosaccharide repeat unit polymerase
MLFLILYLILTIITSINLINILKIQGWSIFSYAYLSLIIFYSVAPLLYYLGIFVFGIKNITLFKLGEINFSVQLLTFVLILISFIMFTFGNKSKKTSGFNFINRATYKNVNYSYILFYFVSFISIIAFIKYIHGFGGLKNAIDMAFLVRTGVYKQLEIGDTTHTVFYRFIVLSKVAFFLFLIIKRKKLVDKIVFSIVTTVMLLQLLFLSGSRQAILDFGLLFVFAQLIKERRIWDKRLFFIILTFFIALPFLRGFLFQSVESLQMENNISYGSYLDEFAFPFYSLLVSISEKYPLMFFSDFISNIFGAFVPSSWNNWIWSNELNTRLLTGYEGYYVPPGILAQGYYSLSFVGVFIITFLTGYFFKYLDDIFNELRKCNHNLIFLYSYIILFSLSWIRTGLPVNYFYHLFFIMTVIFISVSFKKIKKTLL